MQITVTGRHLEITDAIRQYAEGKVNKLPRYFNRVLAIDVVAAKAEAHAVDVEIKVSVAGHDPFVSKVHGPDLYACIDEAVDKLERQLTDHKEKLRQHKGNPPMSG